MKRNYPFVILVALMAVLSLWLFAVLRDLDYQRIERSFETDAEHRYETLKLEIDLNLHAVRSLRALYASDSDVKETEFSTFARYLLSKNPSIQALEWIPRVPNSRRSSYEVLAAGQTPSCAPDHRTGRPGQDDKGRRPGPVFPGRVRGAL